MPYANLEKRRAYHRQYFRQWRIDNPEKTAAYHRKWAQDNPDKNSAIVRRWRARHPEKSRAAVKHWQATHHAQYKDARLRRSHGMTLEQFNAMLRAQGGCCAICRKRPTKGRKKYLSVDHSHALPKGHPKRNRGLLCDNCNHGLGHFRDNPEILKKAIAYLAATC
jgi:hypothetical protein